eukprot:5082970-Alexandrium_andersonii.AAC.1
MLRVASWEWPMLGTPLSSRGWRPPRPPGTRPATWRLVESRRAAAAKFVIKKVAKCRPVSSTLWARLRWPGLPPL